MTKYLLLFLFSFSLNQSIAQLDSTSNKTKDLHYGGRTGLYYTSYLNSPSYFAYFTLGFGNHEFSIGPSIGKPPTLNFVHYGPNFERDYELNGFDLTYRILPNGKGNVFDFYFQADLLQKWGKQTGPVFIHNFPNSGESLKVDQTTQSNATLLFIEYGFDVKFLKYLYVGPAIGFGGKMEFRNYDYGELNQLNFSENFFELDLIFRANIGFRF